MSRIATVTALCVAALLLAVTPLVTPLEAAAMGSAPKEAPPAAKAAPAAKALGIKPQFALSGGKAVLSFRFSEPMIPPAEKATRIGVPIAAPDMPFAVTPPLAGEGTWLDERTFAFTSYDQPPKATQFSISPRSRLTAVSGAAYTGGDWHWLPSPFAFTAKQVRYAPDGTVTIALTFNAQVDYPKVNAALAVADAGGTKLPFALRPDKEEPTGRTLTLLTKPASLGEVTVSLPASFTSTSGPAPLGEKNAACTVETTSMLTIKTVRSQQSYSPPWRRYIKVHTTNSADVDKVRQYLDITPPTDVTIEATSNGFIIAGNFQSRPRLSLTFKKGMPGLTGMLDADHTATVVFKDFSPRMAFDANGSILSPGRSMRLPLTTINVERVRATLWQLPESNIPLMGIGFFGGYEKDLSRKIAMRTGTLGATRNTSLDASIDLKDIAGEAKGVFLLTLDDDSDTGIQIASQNTDDSDEYDYTDTTARSIEKLVVISDIGITARVMPDGVTIWTNSIATAEALANTRVRVFSANNVLLAEGRTDKDGLWRHARAENWLPHERPAIILAATTGVVGKKGKAEPGLAEPSVTDMAYLRLDADLNADATFETGGRAYLRQGYEAFCFTPRGVFRPGETVTAKILLRNAQMTAPEPFPVAWRIRASTGRVVGSGTAMLSPEGGAEVSLPLVPSAPTGEYSLTVSLPGQEKTSLGTCSFSVEDFQPPRIEVTLTPKTPFTTGATPVTIALNAAYLFGAPVADAPWEAQATLMPGTFHHPDWRQFTFPSSFVRNEPGQPDDKTGELNQAGRASLTYTPDDSWSAPVVSLAATIRVREDGGRWVGRTITVPHYTTPMLIGYDFGRTEPQAGSAHAFRIAAVMPDGTPADLKEVTVTVQKREGYYVRSDRGYTYAERYVPVASLPAPLHKGVATVSITPPQRGTYRVSVDENVAGAPFYTTFSVWQGVAGSDDGASSLVDRVMLSWEQPRYQVGETAVLNVRSPFPGKLLLVMESDRELFRMVVPMNGTETSVSIPVLSTMQPNAYCSAWVIRPVREGERWGAHRAYGVTPLLLDRPASTLALTLTAPTKALPRTEIPVSLSLKDAHGKPVRGEVTLALVDEGLLSLTRHATPDPLAFFNAKRSLRSTAFDMYDNLIPLSQRASVPLRPGGGAGADGSFVSPLSRNLEMLSLFVGSVRTNDQGVATTTLQLPEYSGKGRLMAVAATPTAVGSAATEVRVARDLTVEATVPRMVAPGDVFTVPVIVFGDGQKSVAATVTVTTEGPLAVDGKNTFTVALDPATPRAALSLAMKALPMSGPGAVRVTTTIAGSADAPFTQRLELPVRPPFPRVTRSGGGVVQAGEKASIDMGGGFLPGTQRLTLAIADTPGVGLMRALEYLGDYPYGCLEQTTSAAWPYLALPAMLRQLDPDKARDTEFTQALGYAVRRILALQRSDGGFTGWPGQRSAAAYPWPTVYAAHFLTEAKASGLVPEDSLRAALSWMRAFLTSSLPSDTTGITDALSVKAYICYVLALNNDAPLGWIQFLNDQGAYLSQSARIFLAGAQALAAGKPDALRGLGTQPLPVTDRYGWSLESAPRNEALRLLMWTHVAPFSPEAALFARRVIEDGNKNRWRSTQENAAAVLALGRYMEKTAGAKRAFTATLRAGEGDTGQPLAVATDKTPVTLTRKDVPPSPPAPPQVLSLAVQGEGAAYHTWSTSGVPTKAPAPAAQGLSAMRRWVLPDGTVLDFIPDAAGSLPEALRQVTIPHGTRVTVTLYVKPEAAMTSLVLADILPGGFEIDTLNLDPDSEYAARAGTITDPKTGKPFPVPPAYARPLSFNSNLHGRTEARDDRLLLFADSMPSGAVAYTYTIRAVTRGTFTLPPLAAEDMYDPSVTALTPTATVRIE